jgi:hypothetical protein
MVRNAINIGAVMNDPIEYPNIYKSKVHYIDINQRTSALA